MGNSLVTQEQLKLLLRYDPDTGVFTRLTQSSNRVKAGDNAGYLGQNGYLTININHRHYRAHRLAFVYMTGECPEIVDHINGVRSDNRWCNLRPADRMLNAQNLRNRPQGANKLLGVCWNKRANKWMAHITVERNRKHLGYFVCPQEAHAAYLAAKRELHKGCTI